MCILMCTAHYTNSINIKHTCMNAHVNITDTVEHMLIIVNIT